MPVWHEVLLPWRDDDLVQVIGIAQEQHPERTELYSLWQELDWPILWDPFNITGSSAVPNYILVDEHGIVRSTRAPRGEVESFLETEYPAPAKTRAVQASASRLIELSITNPDPKSHEAQHLNALSDLIWRVPGRMQAALQTLEEHAYERADDPLLAFHAGVARRLRYDSPDTQPHDFQAAIDHWTRALSIDPNQYIWRRRIQQYGPRMDKPYPFYNWVAEAQETLLKLGIEAPQLRAALTPAELTKQGGWRAAPRGTTPEPDPEDRILRDRKNWISVETAVAFDTSKKKRIASVHLALRPAKEPSAHWNNESGPMQIWLEAYELPEGWSVDQPLIEYEAQTEEITSRELRHFTYEIELPPGTEDGILDGYALFYICEDAEGRCLYMRKDFSIEVVVP